MLSPLYRTMAARRCGPSLLPAPRPLRSSRGTTMPPSPNQREQRWAPTPPTTTPSMTCEWISTEKCAVQRGGPVRAWLLVLVSSAPTPQCRWSGGGEAWWTTGMYHGPPGEQAAQHPAGQE
ncbi:hypothetical protein KUCAC02_034354 [Chaenocephalus aceratus]|nr:hypothetical protein KUCAC02_034354 [Chaenocephalus aceratus]